MQTYTPEQLREKMKTLPEDLKQAFFSEEVTNTIIQTAKNYGLHVDQYSILGGGDFGINFCLSHPKDFLLNLTNRLGEKKEVIKKAEEKRREVKMPIPPKPPAPPASVPHKEDPYREEV